MMWTGSQGTFASGELERIRGFARDQGDKVLDVLVYGSTVRGGRRPGDLDVLLVLGRVERQDRLDLPFRLRRMLEDGREGARFDVKGVTVDEFLDPNFLPRSRVLIEGFSLLHGEFVCRRFGLDPIAIFTFTLSGLTRSEKTRFQYALKGRAGGTGVLEALGGVHSGRGVVMVPVNASEDFRAFLETWRVGYEVFYGAAEERLLSRARAARSGGAREASQASGPPQ